MTPQEKANRNDFSSEFKKALRRKRHQRGDYRSDEEIRKAIDKLYYYTEDEARERILRYKKTANEKSLTVFFFADFFNTGVSDSRNQRFLMITRFQVLLSTVRMSSNW